MKVILESFLACSRARYDREVVKWLEKNPLPFLSSEFVAKFLEWRVVVPIPERCHAWLFFFNLCTGNAHITYSTLHARICILFWFSEDSMKAGRNQNGKSPEWKPK